jgi:Ni,Fe-hydrogenase III large subunit
MMATVSPGSKIGCVQDVLALLRNDQVRLVSLFGSLAGNGARQVHYILEIDGREYRVATLPVDGPIPSATPVTPAAAWYERELHELFGVGIDGHPNLQPLLSHAGEYRFLQVEGEGVCEVPVGPVHAGIIEPGHFRFSVVGDTVLNLELRHFYTHKGTEKLFEGAPVMSAPMLAESVSGNNCFAHAVAYCQAVENACGISVPPRGRALRLVGLELERMLSHIADLGALCGDVAFAVPAAYTARIKELLLQASTRFFGTRCWRGLAMPGGIRHDLPAEKAKEFSRVISDAARDFAELAALVLETPSLQNRFESTGILSRDHARALGVVGPAARASGLKLDVRHDHPYGAYRKLSLEIPHYHQGDVMARARIRIDETAIAARLIAETLGALPNGAITTPVVCPPAAEGFSAVESPRGELLYWIRLQEGCLRRCHIKSPSFQNWPALPLAMPGNIIADFPVINKSFNLSYSGCDR